jgi:hypothetical protein
MQPNEKLKAVFMQIILEVDRHWAKLSNVERHELTQMVCNKLQNRINADALCQRDAHAFNFTNTKTPDEKDPA